jgi:hypothetical protein
MKALHNTSFQSVDRPFRYLTYDRADAYKLHVLCDNEKRHFRDKKLCRWVGMAQVRKTASLKWD